MRLPHSGWIMVSFIEMGTREKEAVSGGFYLL